MIKLLIAGVMVNELGAGIEGAYSSELANVPVVLVPPAIRTVPSFNNVAVYPERVTESAPAPIKVCVDGSKRSAERSGELLESDPPMINTESSLSAVAVWAARATASF